MLDQETRMTPARMEFLARNGYLVIPDAFSLYVVSELLSELSVLPPAHAHRNLLLNEAIHRFSVSPQVLAFVGPTLGSRAFPVRGILFDKLPGANWKVAWHQDLSIAVKEKHEVSGFGPWSVKEGVPHVQPPAGILRSMLTLRLHLDDCFENNGPVRVLPGSHTAGILTAEQIKAMRLTGADVSTIMPAGGILLMHPLLLHASSPASAPSHRRVIHIEYAASPLPAPLQWHAA